MRIFGKELLNSFFISIGFCLIICFVNSNATLIQLFENVHFYEFNKYENLNEGRVKINSKIINASPFEYKIYGQDQCAKIKEVRYNLKNEIDLKAKTFIYSNYENTLSFLIRISFISPKLFDTSEIEGFEIIFISPENKESCVQILLKNNKTLKNQQKFELTIKDPSFFSQEEKKFLFYFGKVSIRILVKCDDKTSIVRNGKYLCAASESNTDFLQIGIRSNKDTNKNIDVDDVCSGHQLHKTCLMLYSNPSIKYKYLIIIHPMPTDFEILSSFIQENSNDPKNIKSIKQIQSYSYQKFPNQMIIKFIPDIYNSFFYKAYFNKSSDINPCKRNLSEPLGCYCEQKCSDCYHKESYDYEDEHRQKTINFIPFNLYEADDITKSHKCINDDFFEPYDFDSVEMELKFQNQELSNDRKTITNLSNSLSKEQNYKLNREFLPRVCLKSESGANEFSFNLEIMLSDYYQTGFSFYFEKSMYELKLYSFDYKETNNYEIDDLYQIETKLIKFEVNKIFLDEIFEIKNLPQSKYLLEIIPRQKSQFCSESDECVDESIRNNQIQCAKCNKLIVFFTLENSLSYIYNTNSKKKFEYKLFESIEPINAFIKPINNSILKDFKCSEDNVLFKFSSSKDIQNEITFKQKEIYSGIVSNSFKIHSVQLPYINCCLKIPEYHDINVYVLLFKLFLVLFFIIILAFLIKLIFRYYNIKSTHKKKIVLFMSIQIDQQTQEEFLNKIIKPFKKAIEKDFTQLNIDIIDYNTNFRTRKELIETCDLILYVCCTKGELKNLTEELKLGLSEFYHDYNRIQFCKNYKNKCINITFMKSIDIDEQQTCVKNEKYCLMVNSSVNSVETNTSSVFSDIETYGNSYYLKLPQQIKNLVCNFYELNDRKPKKFNPITKFLDKILFKLIIFNFKTTLENSVKNIIKTNKKLIDSTSNLSNDITSIQCSFLNDEYRIETDISDDD